MARPRRSPAQILFTVSVLLIGLWIGITVVRVEFLGQAAQLEPQMRPNVHITNASPEELVDGGFGEKARLLPWSDISYRDYVAANGDFVRVLGCHMEPEGVTQLIAIEPGSRRPPAAGPPPWWPWDREDGSSSPFRVPSWFDPSGEQDLILERYTPGTRDRWEGVYVSYEPETQRLWLWQWRRSDWQPPAVADTERVPLDALAQGFGSHLIAVRAPLSDGGWIQRPGQEPDRMGVPRSALPPRLSLVDVCLRPAQDGRGDHDYLLALHGVREEDLELLLRDHPLRPLPDNGAPPLRAWSFARPEAVPLWFQPGTGPRWGTALLEPGSGRVLSGRWVAYEPEAERLLIWDWARRDGVAAGADIATRFVRPEWPEHLWDLPIPGAD